MADNLITFNVPFTKKKLVSNLVFSCAIVCSSILILGGIGKVHANSVNDDISNIDKYDADFFMTFAPQTLYDILEKIPGANSALLAMNNNAQGRGFGSAGDQILINSKRVSGKENDLRKELANIQARDVDYVELIRGTRSGLDVQSKGLVVNVILKQEIESSIMWSIGGTKSSDMVIKPEGSLIFSDAAGALKYRVGLARNANPTKFTRTDFYRSTEEELTDIYSRIRRNWYIEDEFTTKLEYDLTDNTAIQLNALYGKIYVDADFAITHDNVLENTQELSAITYDWYRGKWEISGDITHQFDQDNRLKVLFISNRADSNDQTWRLDFSEEQAPTLAYELPRLYVSAENVIRTNWAHTINSKHSVDSGMEAAVNSLEENLQFISQSDSLYHSTEINDIEEKRYEVFTNYNFAASSALNFQASLIYEHSTMDVSTDFSLISDINDSAHNQSSRSFSYLKPRFNVRYDLNDIYQLRFNYERTVSQLNLRDFVPKFNRDETRLEETNPDLKPEVRDKLSFSIEKQWQSTDGSISLTPYYHDITDLIVEVPLTTYSGDGNIDSGKEYGFKLDTHFGLDALGLENTTVSANYTWRDSEMVHPFTGEDSNFELLSENDWQVKLNQSDILPGLSFSFTLSKRSPYRYTRHDFQGIRKNRIRTQGFIDYQISNSLKVRLTTNGLFNGKSHFDRRRHSGLFTETDILRHELRQDEREPRYSVTLSGQF